MIRVAIVAGWNRAGFLGSLAGPPTDRDGEGEGREGVTPMRFGRWLLVGVAVASGVVVSAHWSSRAQDRAGRGKEAAPAKGAAAVPHGPTSVQDAMLRPFDLPFGEPTTLEGVRKHLAKALNAPVVLDLAALERLELTPEDTVQLDLKGVRLKVGLKILLDQVGLAPRVEPEDNLLILTGAQEGGDPAERTLAEIKALHRELHDLRDAVDDLRDVVEEDLGVEPDAPRKHTTKVKGGPSRKPRPLSRPGVAGVRG